jgi:hypothetical protein
VDLRARWQRAQPPSPARRGRIAQSALAAGAAWEIALQIPGHGKPFFAPIAAVIALGAERGRRGRRVLATAVVLVVATAAAAPPVVRGQAAASAILVVALHQPGSNLALQRLIDALIGGGIAIVLARLLFPVDPLDLVRDEARQLRARVADALEEVAVALTTGDRGRARSALQRLNALDERRLEDALALARDVARRAPRRRATPEATRGARRVLAGTGSVRERRTRNCDGCATSARRRGAPAPELVEAVRAAAAAVRTIDPEEARATADAARVAAARAREQDASLGASVVAVGVISVAEHALRAAAAREAASVS